MKIALGVEYLGTHFHGWQCQKSNIRTVQQVIEQALSSVANQPVRVFCSGRTDTGVHATCQVIHFETNIKRKNKAWLFGGNVNLPSDVNFTWIKPVDDNFHARFSVISRQYNYKIHNTKIRSSIIATHSLWEPRKLDIIAMNKAGQYLTGKHNFSAFRGSLCQAKSPIKTIEFIKLTKNDDNILLNIKANAFLHHMVRNIVGTLLKVGKGEKPIEWVREVLNSKQRKQAGPTAPPQGLYFIKAFYKNL
ncbi:tRNA pseudouridine(38-40) synthase TruA [Candidatus Vesicomyidisocius sp. SY067_SCS001]|uniref:tRNA pseudouridine(38-40) synthase TruA n=1 Tax=Candidatus Vesicomyidisocius sp. SY067_SCS001 TaxID=2732590 RepID=UPI001689723E|nr:tRNA pseudouridine(38-40) synthase TruA [Candidatus Vesicomyosocius sp. SY067_SCS001]